MHVLVFPGSPLLSRRPGRVLLQTAWKARASPAIGSQLLPSGVSYSPLFSLTTTPLTPPPGDGLGTGGRAPSVTLTSPRALPAPALPGHSPSSLQHRTMLQTLGNEGVEAHFTRSNRYRDHTGKPTGTPAGRSQHTPVHRDTDGGSRRGSELERLMPAKSKNSNSVPARAICRGCTIYTSETQAPVH